jgi:hypothetical protein
MKQRLRLEISRLEYAAFHQARALSSFREAQDASRVLSPARRRCLQMRALEHLLHARGLLQETQRGVSADGDLRSTLDKHLARLDQMIVSVEKLVDSQASLQEQS